MELRGWESSSLEKPDKECEPTPVLGLLWDKEEDTLFCNVNNISEPTGILTRRTLLSVTQKVFDPIGFTSSVTLYPKVLLQESWKEKLSWGTSLPKEVCDKFLKWFQELNLLKHLKIPRRIILEDAASVSLHVFCDASGLSYAAVVFVRNVRHDEICVQMALAKSRVAPLKKMSIPRLELMACTIGARLLDFVKKTLELKDVPEYFWTDSATALYWICHEEPWGVFVQNRVKEIRKLSNTEDWRHIQGTQNPANLPTRGCRVEKLINSRWWEGPEWLSKEEREWPKSSVQSTGEANQEKLKVALVVNSPLDREWYVQYFFSYKKILRMVACMRRFISNCKRSQKERLKGELSGEEINAAEKNLMKIVQQEQFSVEYLRSLKTVTSFEDKEGLIRVKTKLTERKDFENFKTPILLPRKHKLVELMIRESHINLLHCGLNNLLVDVREKFWVVNARKIARRILSRCIRCKRHSAKNIETMPVPLPEDRIKEASVFEVVGVDLAGPLSLKRSTKRWIVIFTCAVFRAIHLELVQSLSTKSFLLCFRRFIARRGRPHIVYSDNGTNFVGANNLLTSIDWETVQKEAHMKIIIWKFNPPTAAWWGGFWERLIQVLKKMLRRVLGRVCITYEEMVTLLYDCESIINSRPITYISENDQYLNPLTPAMFLQDMHTVGVPDLDHLDEINITRRYRYQQNLREELRKRFRSEYLGQLVLAKSNNKCEEVKLNDIVLVEGTSKKRAFWPLGLVIAIFPGKDGISRVVKIKTDSGELLRPVQRVYPMEVEAFSNSYEEVQKTVGQLREKNRVLSLSVPKEMPEQTTRYRRVIHLPSKLRDFELS